jgi:hypothetical protein
MDYCNYCNRWTYKGGHRRDCPNHDKSDEDDEEVAE